MRTRKPGRVALWLQKAPAFVFVTYAIFAAFVAYFCMYAFRKPFAAAQFEGLRIGFLQNVTWACIDFGKIQLKTALVISQIVGYTLSKFMGIKFCSEITWEKRAFVLVSLVLLAELALLLFGVVPPDYKVFAIFLNGLPLGMVWGLVVGYLEGRRTSELLLAGLSCSFIVASGVVKDVGRFLMSDFNVSEAWMPAATGVLFFPAFVIAVWLLDQLPRPSKEDIMARVKREPMYHRERQAFVQRFVLGLLLLFIAYFFLTAYRDFRDNYGIELLTELGHGQDKTIFSKTEMPVAFGVMLCLALLNTVKDNRKGLIATFGLMLFGICVMGGAIILLDMNLISGLTWMILIGLGAYLTYVPFGSVLFDRLIASTGAVGTAVFAIYVADALGYTGSVGVQLYKDLFAGDESKLEFFRRYTYFMVAIGIVCLAVSCIYFFSISRPTQSQTLRSQSNS
jgi:hypothetical protein